MNVAKIVALGAIGVAASVASAQSPLNLTPSFPDVFSGAIAVDYNATSGLFTASGFTQSMALVPNGSIPMGQRQFFISAILSNLGTINGAGSMIVRGDYGGTDQVLFSSNNILAFGFSATSKFEFLFSQDAGSLAPVGTPIGTILTDTNISFPGGIPDFHQSFSGRIFPGGPGAGTADTFAPAPSAAALLGLAGLTASRRRRS